MNTPCENDHRPERMTCYLEATHMTGAGLFLCEQHATEHNDAILANKWIKHKDRYLAQPRKP